MDVNGWSGDRCWINCIFIFVKSDIYTNILLCLWDRLLNRQERLVADFCDTGPVCNTVCAVCVLCVMWAFVFFCCCCCCFNRLQRSQLLFCFTFLFPQYIYERPDCGIQWHIYIILLYIIVCAIYIYTNKHKTQNTKHTQHSNSFIYGFVAEAEIARSESASLDTTFTLCFVAFISLVFVLLLFFLKFANWFQSVSIHTCVRRNYFSEEKKIIYEMPDFGICKMGANWFDH